MTETEIADRILTGLYHWWEHHSGGSVFSLAEDMPEVEPDAFEKAALMLERSNMIRGVGQSMHCDITATGIEQAESRGLVPYENYERYWRMRYSALTAAASVYDLSPRDEVSVNDLIQQFSYDESEFFNNVRFLSDGGSLDLSGWHFRITSHGLQQYRRLNFRQLLADDLARIRELSPQDRGIQFQKLLVRVLESQRWNTQESARTLYEEIDIFIDRHGSYYLIECKWTAAPSGTEATSHLFAKLMRREGVKGILMSMSGFTTGAVTSVEEASSSKIILFFGKNDIEQIVKEPDNFDQLLLAKEREFVTQRKVSWN